MSRTKAYRRSFDGDFFGGDDDAYEEKVDADPRVGLVNLADVMLVLACGLMVALVAHWNIDLSQVSEVEAQSEMTEISQDDINRMADEMQNGFGNSYEQRGTVYEDPTTGQLYMLEQEYDTINTEEDGSYGGDAEGMETDDSYGGQKNG